MPLSTVPRVLLRFVGPLPLARRQKLHHRANPQLLKVTVIAPFVICPQKQFPFLSPQSHPPFPRALQITTKQTRTTCTPIKPLKGMPFQAIQTRCYCRNKPDKSLEFQLLSITHVDDNLPGSYQGSAPPRLALLSSLSFIPSPIPCPIIIHNDMTYKTMMTHPNSFTTRSSPIGFSSPEVVQSIHPSNDK